MIKRRGLLTLALTAAVLGAVPGPADARCALLPLAQEIAQSRYVFEGVVESSAGQTATLRVTASWKGSPPPRVQVRWSGRGNPFTSAAPTTTFLVFASGASDDQLSAYRCGATGQLGSVPVAQLEAAGLHRTAR